MMPYETDQRLKSYLDTNQLHREQMCRAILAVDKRFTDVQPRHPRGGPDGGRDIEATFRREEKAFGAVGFVNGANDSREQKASILGKFKDDLDGALAHPEKPTVFVFLTNVSLTIGEKDGLTSHARSKDMVFCEVFDRERLRIQLDSPDGFFIRYQYLQIPLSDGEQASFFARWGDEIQSVIATGFRNVERSLDRILFLQESSGTISNLSISLELDREYNGDEIGHFRAFASFYLKEIKHKIYEFMFGSSDKANRVRHLPEDASRPDFPGIVHGIGGGQWELHVDSLGDLNAPGDENDGNDVAGSYVQVGRFSSIGMNKVRFISINYDKDSFVRFEPTLCLRDLDEAGYMFMLNDSLAARVKAIHVIANGYKLDEFSRDDLSVDRTEFHWSMPVEFTAAELEDPWVRIWPSNIASNFTLRFSEQTPKRLFAHRPARNSLPPWPGAGTQDET